MGRALSWSDDAKFILDGTTFRLDVFASVRSRPDRFILAKPRWLVQEYVDLAPQFTGGRIVELGIAQGGSAAFFAHLLSPCSLLVVDIAEEPVAALAEFIATRGYSDTVHAEYGVDQSDRGKLATLLARDLGTGPLDLVVDDASHLLGPTVASFAALFPRLRPGGVFVLEDWSQGHSWERAMRSQPGQFGPEAFAEPRAPATRAGRPHSAGQRSGARRRPRARNRVRGASAQRPRDSAPGRGHTGPRVVRLHPLLQRDDTRHPRAILVNEPAPPGSAPAPALQDLFRRHGGIALARAMPPAPVPSEPVAQVTLGVVVRHCV